MSYPEPVRHEQQVLPPWTDVLVVVAHPDDESFGLGAVISEFAASGARVRVLCLTQGEASTLGAEVDDLAAVRRSELEAAGGQLGIVGAELLDHPDGGLAGLSGDVLPAAVRSALDRDPADGLLVFDPSGVTGHPDHQAATSAAVRVATERGLPVLAWTLPEPVATTVNLELGMSLVGYPTNELDLAVRCSRAAQLRAVRAHASQAVPSSPLWRRLELLGDTEWLRWLNPPPRTSVS